MWYHVKVLHITHNLFAGTDTLSLSVYEPIAMRVLWEGEGRPPFREWVVLESRVWYSVTVLLLTTICIPLYNGKSTSRAVVWRSLE